jgi:hypothetical protein
MSSKTKTLKPRCGICDVELTEEWEDHVKTPEHKSKFPRIDFDKFGGTPKKKKVQQDPVKKIIPEETKRFNKKMKLDAKAENLGYYPVADGLSYYETMCECGNIVDVYCWRGQKRCDNCWKVISTALSFSPEGLKENTK